MKTISVKDKVWQEISKLKVELMASDLNSAIEYLLYEKYKEENK